MKTFLKGSLALPLLICLAIALWPEAKYVPYTPDESYLTDSSNYAVPPMPMDWEWNSFTASDGTKLRWGKTKAEDAKATVILIPGYTSTVDMYGEHINTLAARGYHVIGIDLRGQGGSERHRESHPQKLYAENFGVYSDDVAAFIKAQEIGDDAPVLIVGSSFGGHVALRVAGDHDTAVDGLVLLAPAYEPNTAPFSKGLTKFITRLGILLGKGEAYAPMQMDWRPDGTDLTLSSDCASEPKRLYLRDTVYVRDPAQRVGGVSNNYLYGIIKSGEMLQEEAYETQITLPVHMVVAANDVILNGATSEAACTDGLPNCKLIKIPDTGHCLLLETDSVLGSIYNEIDALYTRLKP